MKATEVRIGNFIASGTKYTDTSLIGKVLSIGSLEQEFEQIYCECDESFEWFFRDNYCGIPLTEERLIELGFIKKGTSRYGNKFVLPVADWGFTIENSFQEGKWFFGHEYYDSGHEQEDFVSHHFCFDLEFIHQLQNIISSLTNTELIWNQKQ